MIPIFMTIIIASTITIAFFTNSSPSFEVSSSPIKETNRSIAKTNAVIQNMSSLLKKRDNQKKETRTSPEVTLTKVKIAIENVSPFISLTKNDEIKMNSETTMVTTEVDEEEMILRSTKIKVGLVASGKLKYIMWALFGAVWIVSFSVAVSFFLMKKCKNVEENEEGEGDEKHEEGEGSEMKDEEVVEEMAGKMAGKMTLSPGEVPAKVDKIREEISLDVAKVENTANSLTTSNTLKLENSSIH
ncbi:hypothetical protein HELRODRAFT_165486 [Helobdella robusta]|uniref:Transmembrane protein n=1 Tax=Helobdella robusta TaxID=6412 RepID=T1EWW2_HELRO|nr:hypothetical protein HELRODRAFT_165486 [Helobdella robusta]ESN91450.1 hypothetical protein HELRODRAFT_165486 [Helobdella robusta]